MSAVIQWLRRIIYLLLAVLLLILGYWIGAENPQTISVTLMGIGLPPLSLGSILCAALLLGVVVGCLVSMIPIFKLSNLNMSLRRKLKRRDTEIARLRTAGIKD